VKHVVSRITPHATRFSSSTPHPALSPDYEEEGIITHLVTLQSKIENGSAVVGVIGLGYVGLPLLAAFHRAGFPVLGFDIDPAKIASLKKGESYLKHLGPELASNLLKGAKFDATADFGRLGEADVVISCVPTPLGKHLSPICPTLSRPPTTSPRRCARDSSSFWNPRPIPAPPAKSCSRASKRPASSAARTSTSPTRPSAKTPAGRISTR
jgi:hypothetical protein